MIMAFKSIGQRMGFVSIAKKMNIPKDELLALKP